MFLNLNVFYARILTQIFENIAPLIMKNILVSLSSILVGENFTHIMHNVTKTVSGTNGRLPSRILKFFPVLSL